MSMLGYEIVLRTYADEEHNALRIFVKQSNGTSNYIDLSHDAVRQLEGDLKRILDKYEMELEK